MPSGRPDFQRAGSGGHQHDSPDRQDRQLGVIYGISPSSGRRAGDTQEEAASFIEPMFARLSARAGVPGNSSIMQALGHVPSTILSRRRAINGIR